MSDKYPGGFVTANAPAGFSVAFDGSGDYLSGVPSTAYDFGTSENYSVEFWAYLNNVPSSFAFTGGNATGAFGINYDTAGGYLKCGKGGVGNQLTTSYVLQSGQWYHIVFCRQSSTLSAFVNGTRVATTTDSTSYTATAGFIGGDTSFASMNGYLSNFRIVTGSSAYNPSSTTITVPTQLFPITNTALLTCQSPTIIDTSGNAVTLTAVGDAKVSNFTPFAAYTGFNPALGAAAGGVWTLDEAAYYQQNRLWPIYDPYFNQTTLMLHGNGTNAAQNNTFLDSSNNSFPITRNGNTTQGTFSPFSQTGWSTYFNGSSYLTVTNAATQMAFGTGDWQIEMFLYPTSLPSTDNVPFDGRVSNGAYPVIIVKGTAASPSQKVVYYVNTSVAITSDATLPLNAWSHVMVSRVSGTTRMFINGVVQSGTYADSTTYLGGNSQPWIGANGGVAEFWNGYISNVRILKGSGTSASFTPSTTPLTAVTNTVVLTCQSNRFVDNSASNLTITAGSAPQVQAFSPFVPAYITPTTYSNWFDGNSDFLTIAGTSTACALPGDFTIELWLYNVATTLYGSLFSTTASINTTNGLRISTGNSNNIFEVASALSGIFSSSTAFSNNAWVHVALVRSGTTLTLYQNGVSVGSVTNSQSFVSDTFYIGNATGLGSPYYLNGVISNLRVVKGTALYTASFTPPTAPLTAITNTTLLTCQSSTFIDNSVSALTLTANGTVQPVTSPTPFPAKIDTTTLNSAYSTSLIGGSGYFDGSGDYLSFSGPTIGTGAFCLEAWVYCTSTFSNQTIFGADGTNNRISIKINNSTTISVDQYGVSASNFTVAAMALNAWNHIAVSRNGSSVATVFVNGVRSSTGTATLSNNYTTFNAIGRFDSGSGYYLTGYIAGARATVGSTPYDPTTTGFAVPYSAPTNITNTQLLLNYTNGAIFDNTAKNVLETVGNAQISTTQSKWGGSSMYFDGSGDYLFVNSSANNIMSLGTGDFTVETWVNFSNISNNPCICSGYVDSSNGWYFQYYSNAIELAVGSTALISKAATVSNGTWYHMAVTRAGGTLRAFLNGVQQGTSVTGSTTNLNVTNGFYVGILNSSFAPTTRTFAGYLDDLRITKGVARYTTDFTPPTSQLQDQ